STLGLVDMPPLVSLALRPQREFSYSGSSDLQFSLCPTEAQASIATSNLSPLWSVFYMLTSAGADLMHRTVSKRLSLASPDLVLFSACLGNPWLFSRLLLHYPHPMAVLHDLYDFARGDHSFL